MSLDSLPTDIVSFVVACVPLQALLQLGASARRYDNLSSFRIGAALQLTAIPFGLSRSNILHGRELCPYNFSLPQEERTLMRREGADVLAAALRSGALPHLTCLDLDCNRIGDQGMSALAAAISEGCLRNIIRLTHR